MNFQKISFRICLYVTSAYTLALGQYFLELLTSQEGNFRLYTMAFYYSAIINMYLIGFKKLGLSSVLTSAPRNLLLVCYQGPFVKQTQTTVASADNKLSSRPMPSPFYGPELWACCL